MLGSNTFDGPPALVSTGTPYFPLYEAVIPHNLFQLITPMLVSNPKIFLRKHSFSTGVQHRWPRE
jgi:hypothetical protein